MTPHRDKRTIDPGDLLAWPLRGNLYLQSLDTVTGHERIFRQSAHQMTRAVPIPHQPSDDVVVTVHGAQMLVIAAKLCAQHTSLLWINPATGHEVPLINTAPDLAGLQGAVPFDSPIADVYIGTTCPPAAQRMVKF